MTVLEQTASVEYTGNGLTKIFALDFPCDHKAHVRVTIDAIEPVCSSWSLIDQSVVFQTAPASGQHILIQGKTLCECTAELHHHTQSGCTPRVNTDFDGVWSKLQELGVAEWLLDLKIKKEIKERIAAEMCDYKRSSPGSDEQINAIKECIEALVNRPTDEAVLPTLDRLIKTWKGNTQEDENKYFSQAIEDLVTRVDIIQDVRSGFYKPTFANAVTYHIPADFPNMQVAVDSLKQQTIHGDKHIILNLQKGYREKYGLRVANGDYSKFYIQSEDAEVLVADDFIGVGNIDAMGGGTTITGGSVILAYRAKTPVLGCIFNGNQNTKARTLMFCIGGSTGFADRLVSSSEEFPNAKKIAGGKNFKHATFQAQECSIIHAENTVGTGCGLNSYYAERNSLIHCEFSDASNSAQAGVMATRASRVNADTMNVSGCLYGMWASRGALISACDAVANGCRVYGFYADMGAKIISHAATANGIGANMPTSATQVQKGSAFFAYRGSEIEAASAKVDGAYIGVSAFLGSKVVAFGSDIKNCSAQIAQARYAGSSIELSTSQLRGNAGGIIASDGADISVNSSTLVASTSVVVAASGGAVHGASAKISGGNIGVHAYTGGRAIVSNATISCTEDLRCTGGGQIFATSATYTTSNVPINSLTNNGVIFK